ncbi:MAG TPA: hypothetical protein VM553_21115, partial [Dongiaceae bacterium]|nr:hypothetical protein [Dongiaceae bacterium]
MPAFLSRCSLLFLFLLCTFGARAEHVASPQEPSASFQEPSASDKEPSASQEPSAPVQKPSAHSQDPSPNRHPLNQRAWIYLDESGSENLTETASPEDLLHQYPFQATLQGDDNWG